MYKLSALDLLQARHSIVLPHTLLKEEVDLVNEGLGQQKFEFRVGEGMGTVGNKFNEVETVEVIEGVLHTFK